MPVDVYLSRDARAFLNALPLEEQQRVRDAIDYPMVDSDPDGSSKVRLPLPYRFGTISYRSGGFFLTYEFENAMVVHVLTISRAGPDYWG
ncbi:MAG: hypothetical protein OXE50_11055 [Chloroflexi bacterium]|nr:hypothetical protein [Chloroflexota bacterium]